MPMHNPRHPGPFIHDEIIEPNRLTVTAAADLLGVGRPALSSLLNARANLSPEMALRVEMAFGIRMETLMRMQLAHDIVQVRARAAEIHVTPFTPATAA